MNRKGTLSARVVVFVKWDFHSRDRKEVVEISSMNENLRPPVMLNMVSKLITYQNNVWLVI